MSLGPIIRTRSGVAFHFLKPQQDEIKLNDIVWALSHINRFTGHTRVPYSVAEHACRVAELVPDELKLTALCHDNSEAYTNDCNTHLKSCLPQFKEIELRLEKAIAKRFGLIFPFPADIKRADMTMLVTEFRDLMPNTKDYKSYPFTPLKDRIVPWSPEKARREFLKAFRRYSR